jgi:tetratricopeptide (TPR) repeat protein
MKPSQVKIGFLLFVLVTAASGCGMINSLRVKSALNETARAYKEKDYPEAERHARRALALDPDNESVRLYVARTVHVQYRKGDDSPENVAKAEEAIGVYRDLVKKNPNNDEAFTAVTVLLNNLGRRDEVIKWVEERANNEAVAPERRSDAFAILSDKDWECSNQVTENKANQRLVERPDGSVVKQWVKPSDPKQYEDAVRCVASGLEKAEKAISLNPDSEKGWGQKYKLLREGEKLAKMDENEEKAKEYAKQAQEAEQKGKEIFDRKKAKEPPKPTPAAG